MVRKLGLALAVWFLSTPTMQAQAIDGGDRRDDPEWSRCYSGENAVRLVNALYHAVLYRDAEVPGMYGWVDLLEQGGYQGLLRAAEGIGDSDEFRYDVQRAHRADDILEQMYFSLLGRAVDPYGFRYWLPMLEQGRGGETLRGIVGSDEFYESNLRDCF